MPQFIVEGAPSALALSANGVLRVATCTDASPTLHPAGLISTREFASRPVCTFAAGRLVYRDPTSPAHVIIVALTPEQLRSASSAATPSDTPLHGRHRRIELPFPVSRLFHSRNRAFALGAGDRLASIDVLSGGVVESYAVPGAAATASGSSAASAADSGSVVTQVCSLTDDECIALRSDGGLQVFDKTRISSAATAQQIGAETIGASYFSVSIAGTRAGAYVLAEDRQTGTPVILMVTPEKRVVELGRFPASLSSGHRLATIYAASSDPATIGVHWAHTNGLCTFEVPPARVALARPAHTTPPELTPRITLSLPADTGICFDELHADIPSDCEICFCPLRDEDSEPVDGLGDGTTAVGFGEVPSNATVATLDCGHVFHSECLTMGFNNAESYKAKGHKIVFNLARCPAGCPTLACHSLFPTSAGIQRRFLAVTKDAKERGAAEFPGVHGNDLLGKYMYYVCGTCGEPYWGGDKSCAQSVTGEADVAPETLACLKCKTAAPRRPTCCSSSTSAVSASSAPAHDTDALVWQCQTCCNPATHFSFGRFFLCERCFAVKNTSGGNAGSLPPEAPCPGRDACPFAHVDDAARQRGAGSALACLLCQATPELHYSRIAAPPAAASAA